jgi:hypothetical protein
VHVAEFAGFLMVWETVPRNCFFMHAASSSSISMLVSQVLRSIPKEAFADSFQKLYERCQQCVVKDGDYFEGQKS